MPRVSEHFRFEEETGYVEMVRKLEPYQARTLKRLIEEHHWLTVFLETMTSPIEVLVRRMERRSEG